MAKSFWQTKQRISQTPTFKIKQPTDRRYRFHISPRRSSRFSVHRIESSLLKPIAPWRASVERIIFVARSVSLVEQASKISKFVGVDQSVWVCINVLITTRNRISKRTLVVTHFLIKANCHLRNTYVICVIMETVTKYDAQYLYAVKRISCVGFLLDY